MTRGVQNAPAFWAEVPGRPIRNAPSQSLQLSYPRLPASQRYKRHDRSWKRYEKQVPGHQVQINVKFIEPIAGVTGHRGGRNKYYRLHTTGSSLKRPGIGGGSIL